MTSNFTYKHYVIIFGGNNDFYNNKSPNIREIKQKIEHCTHTNILLLPVMCKYYNKFISRFNNKLKELALLLNNYSKGYVHFISIDGIKKNESCELIAKKIEVYIKGEKKVKT